MSEVHVLHRKHQARYIPEMQQPWQEESQDLGGERVPTERGQGLLSGACDAHGLDADSLGSNPDSSLTNHENLDDLLCLKSQFFHL